MKTLALEQPGHFSFRNAAKPEEPAAEQALVRVNRVGICGTDLHAFEGKQPFFSYPRILGHELSVEVVDVGKDVKNVAVGDLCSVRPYLACGNCSACHLGKNNCCLNLKVLGVHIDGGMQDWLMLPAANLHRSNQLSLEELALVEPLSIGAHGVWRSGATKGDKVLVIGAGPIGLAVIAGVRALEASFAVLEVSPAADEFLPATRRGNGLPGCEKRSGFADHGCVCWRVTFRGV